MKNEIIEMFKKLSKVYDDNYIIRGIARNKDVFCEQTKRGCSLAQMLESMNAKEYAILTAVIRTLFIEDNKDARPFVKKGNFAIKFDDIVKYMVKIIQK